eukprot:Mrub_06132.p2 GENE.Mrub_06132~~Mrub_06132.p2  ORF type:complete len:117 (+),score=14.76 Mrub_06132:135-485(+)
MNFYNEIDEFSKKHQPIEPQLGLISVSIDQTRVGECRHLHANSKVVIRTNKTQNGTSDDYLNFRDIHENCKILETEIFPKVEEYTQLIKLLFQELSTIKKEIYDLTEVIKKGKNLQ